MPLLVTAFLGAVVQLLQHCFQLVWDRQSEMGCVLNKGNAFIGEIEEDDSRAQDAAAANHLRVNNMTDAHQQENQHLAADAPKAHLAGQGLIGDADGGGHPYPRKKDRLAESHRGEHPAE